MNTMNTTTQISVIKIRTDGSAAHRDLPKLNARSIDDPADPVKLPLRPKNDVVPSPLLTADWTFAARSASASAAWSG